MPDSPHNMKDSLYCKECGNASQDLLEVISTSTIKGYQTFLISCAVCSKCTYLEFALGKEKDNR